MSFLKPSTLKKWPFCSRNSIDNVWAAQVPGWGCSQQKETASTNSGPEKNCVSIRGKSMYLLVHILYERKEI